MLDKSNMEYYSSLLEKKVGDKEKWYRILKNYKKMDKLRGGKNGKDN